MKDISESLRQYLFLSALNLLIVGGGGCMGAGTGCESYGKREVHAHPCLPRPRVNGQWFVAADVSLLFFLLAAHQASVEAYRGFIKQTTSQ